jgi:preprotein translocase subunit SecD
VPQGTVVVQAEQLHSAAPVAVVSPAARFFVLRDVAALTGDDIVNPRASTDQGGQPDVTFGLTGTGQSAFQRVTRTIAHRGPTVSLGGLTLNQHFAVALDDQLLTVPQISYHQYPDGVIGAKGADVVGGFTTQFARDLATELRDGPLPFNLRVVP